MKKILALILWVGYLIIALNALNTTWSTTFEIFDTWGLDYQVLVLSIVGSFCVVLAGMYLKISLNNWIK